MTEVSVAYIDVYVLRTSAGGFDVLCLRRGPDGRCPGSWETVHGHIEPGEKPADAAVRELREETGLAPSRLYNLSRVETFYEHSRDRIALIPVFCALVAAESQVRLGPEHETHEWLGVGEAKQRFAWPRERRALEDLMILVLAGELEDVLRVR